MHLQLYVAVPQVLLPVIPHLTSELQAEDPGRRLAASQLLGRLLSLPGNKLVSEYKDVLEALLTRVADPEVRGLGGQAGQGARHARGEHSLYVAAALLASC